MVGTGVYTSLGFQVASLGSGFPIMLLWVLGGMLAFCGATCYAELAAAMPRSGGEYQYLSRIYHPGVGFLSGWISLIAGFPAPVALNALIFSQSICALLGYDSPWLIKQLALAVIAALTGAHLVTVRFSGAFQTGATLFKFVVVATMGVAGWSLAAAPGALSLTPQVGDTSIILSGEFATSLLWVTYAYAGWNAATYITGELRHPQRDVPRALLIGCAVVTVLYVLVNGSMLRAVPGDVLSGRLDVATLAVFALFGPVGGTLMGVLIAVGLISSMSAMIWAGPRVTREMARDYALLDGLAKENAGGVPTAAVLLQAGIAGFMVWFASPQQIITTTAFILQVMALLTVLGVFILRKKEPHLARPVRAWGHPFSSAVFLVAASCMLGASLLASGEATSQGTVILLAGVAFYYVARGTKRISG